ncbi:bifunctional transcriptional activator/DNA repair enzyme AdaA [Paenibacillus sp. GCM10012307]|uniref:Methylphosphotriester-DNA--protein-cysteine methyltransferase family protein n=1 Tax=Paenibacillus roseus TaxID=2798579 RepID=A0A934MRA3_9BACL|nr:bifunctional transcriptional activator/DNA repair enzyme AdaA [Paenibacillus roseus]MBJ6362693.1 methylphosphotriester-DNA--protein-cysteine methyltransferase family protein [Paenibacillus roseus]
MREKGELQLTNQRWKAITKNDSAYDGSFFYAVVTTGIYCRPSCKSRLPIREHVRLFETAEAANKALFRSCKRCMPGGRRLPDEEWISQIVGFIETSYAEPLTLKALSQVFHGSPYHLQRTFKRITGISPFRFIQHVRMEKAKELLNKTEMSIMDIAIAVGINNAAHFATLFRQKTGCTPTVYSQLSKLNHTGKQELAVPRSISSKRTLTDVSLCEEL